MARLTVAVCVACLAVAGCGKKDKDEPNKAPEKNEPAPDKDKPKPKPKVEEGDKPIVVKDVGFMTPESVLYDDQADVYLVSNINGDPFAKDGNGFISKVGPDGKVIELKWIDGAAEGVELNAPKGMAVLGDTLFVADIDTVRTFHRTEGKVKGAIPIKGVTFLNDLAAGDKSVFVSDSGLLPGFKPSGTDAVYRVDDGATELMKDKKLGGPNGVLVQGDEVWTVGFSKPGKLQKIKDGKIVAAVQLPKGQLDGLVAVGDGTFLVSSWEASAVYRGKAAGPFAPVIENVKSPADIGFDTKRKRVLIPLFNDNEVQIHTLK